MEAYLDNSATTRCSRRVQETVLRMMDCDYGNPSSLHKKGMEAEAHVRKAAAEIARTLRVSEKEIFFTSGGTESNNLALIGAAMANRRSGNRLITTQVEHSSVRNTMAYLEKQGFEVIYLPVDKDGILLLDSLREAVNSQTVLVSIMQANNETGALQPVAEAASIVRQINPAALVHADAVQSYGKMRIRPKKEGIDLLSVSGHKIHGPKGVGFLYIREKTKITPLSFGGGQQSGMRSGTHNVPGIAGLGEAAKEAYEGLEEKTAHLYSLKERFLEKTACLEGVTVNGRTGHDSAPHIVSLSIEGVRSEVLLHALEEYNIYVSAGSACSSSHRAPSQTLQAMKLKPELADSTLRFSFSVYTAAEEIDYAAAKLAEIVPRLRRYVRR